VAVAGGGVGLPQPSLQGSVMVTGTGVLSQTWQSLTVTVKPCGTWSSLAVPVAHVGVGSAHSSVTVYVTGTKPVEQSDWYTVV